MAIYPSLAALRLPCCGALLAENFGHWMTENFSSERPANTSAQSKASIIRAGRDAGALMLRSVALLVAVVHAAVMVWTALTM